MIEEFIHDVRVILSSIRGNAELIEMSTEDGNVKDHALRIMKGVDFLENLVMGFKRIVEGKADIKPTDPCEIIDGIIQTLETDFEMLEREYEVKCDGKKVKADGILLYRVLLNLIENSLRHGSGRIRIKVENGVITVGDEGKWKEGRKGLGLSIVRKLVEMMGGSFEIVENECGKTAKVKLEVVE